LRTLALRDNDDPKWIILDGDLDPNWIESMNSLMDDNKILTLANNDRLNLPPCMRIVLETADIQHVSPATISRAGVLWVPTSKGRNWKNVVAAWVQTQDRSDWIKAALQKLCDQYIPTILDWVCGGQLPKETDIAIQSHVGFTHSSCTLVVQTSIELVQSFLKFLGGMMTNTTCRGNTIDEVIESIQNSFAFAALWSFGGCLADVGGSIMGKDVSSKDRCRARFDAWFRHSFPDISLPTRDTVYDYWLDTETNGFEPWKASPGFHSVDFDSGASTMQNVTVPTPEICAIRFWVAKAVAVRRHCLLVGKAGVGKSHIIQAVQKDLNPATLLYNRTNFDYCTTSDMLLKMVESRLETKAHNTYGPPGNPGTHMVIFVDDMNLPKSDEFGTTPVLELMRQHMDVGHWHHPEKMSQHQIRDCQYVGAVNPDVARDKLNPRIQRHFTVLAVNFPNSTSLVTIFQTFLDGHLKLFRPEIRALSPSLINASISMHSSMVANFHKSVQTFHYEFNLRHIARVFQGILMVSPTTMDSPAKIALLWLHETMRVYGDCLVNKADISTHRALLAQIVKRRFPQFSLSPYVADQGDGVDPLVFCHFATSLQKKEYDKVEDISELHGVLAQALVDYNTENYAMQLVLFDDAINHICRIIRIVCSPYTHGLLVGVGGSGKRSLVKLSSHICQYKLVQLTRKTSAADFVDQLKELTVKVGVNGTGTIFLITDLQIYSELFLVPLNEWLSTGHPPESFFTAEERDSVVHNIRNRAKIVLKVADPSSNTCWTFFQSEVARKFHFIFSFSPLHPLFRSRADRFPALFKCTILDFFHPWPKTALIQVARKYLAEINPEIFSGKDELLEATVDFMPYCVQSFSDIAETCAKNDRRVCYATPKSFLELLKLFTHLLSTTTNAIRANENRLDVGVQKLRQAGRDAAEVSDSMQSLVAEAEATKGKAEEIASIIARDKAKVEESTARVNSSTIHIIYSQSSKIQFRLLLNT
jgi:dynein heavy chain